MRYVQSVTEYMRLGHAELVPEEITDRESPGDRWYMQHLPVYNPLKPDKLRIVFNLSLQCDGISLNDVLLKGPDFYPSQNGVLLHFRMRRIAVSADIEKMFLQVQVIKGDQPYLSFWWREPGDKKPPRTYQMLVEVFGAVSSPSSCLYIIRKIVVDNPEYGDLEDKIKLNIFVKYLDSFDSLEEAESTCRRLLSKGGFRLNQWTSSSRELLCKIPQSKRNQPKLDLDWDKLPMERMLGNWFDAEDGTFNFKFKALEDVKTMRQLMAAIASVYDPLGFIAAVVVTAKIIKQDAWKEKIGLDDELPQHILSRWQTWYLSLNHLNELNIPRCLEDKAEPKSNGREELHVFCDASEAAFGSVVYWRKEYPTKVHVSFALAKTRVAPIKPLTIPKLELQAAVLGFRLSRTLLEELQLSCPVVFWTDSQTVLQWIGSRHYKMERFVTNRVAEILELSKLEQWRHVPGQLNPADDCFRRINATSLNPNHGFLKGPEFLFDDRTTWPSLQAIKPTQTVVIAATREEIIRQDDMVEKAEDRKPVLLLIEEFSSIGKIQRMVARLKQCARIWRIKRLGETQPPMWLKSKDLKEALLVCLREVQMKEFGEEVATIKKGKPISATSHLKKLTPIIDNDGVLRIGGRLEHSHLPYEAKHPVIRAPNLLAERIVADTHLKFNHSSAERTFYESRAKYWILRGRKVAKKVARSCVRCKRLFGKPPFP